MPTIDKTSFGTTKDGQAVDLYTLTNDHGLVAKLTNYGAILTEFWAPDRNGQLADVVLGFDELEPYESKSPHFGSTIGRVGNRIAKGRFELDGRQFVMVQNNGENHLHGGTIGYDRRVWSAEAKASGDAASVSFFLLDADGEEGYAGNVEVWVTYSLTNENVLQIDYRAVTDEATPINLTNHSYWNLKDGGATDILNHVLEVHSDSFTPVDDGLIPTGHISTVENTPLDFRSPKPVGRDIEMMSNDPRGFDHNFVLRNANGDLTLAANLYEPVTGRRMETWTTEPGVQFYSGNFLNGSIYGKGGVQYRQYSALCLETQHFPDSVNQPTFPSIVLRPGETYRQITEYRFFVSD
jgi:aldose 1-epimerase